jgi:cytochrome P450 family 142 subfamily A polypeptide 1
MSADISRAEQLRARTACTTKLADRPSTTKHRESRIVSHPTNPELRILDGDFYANDPQPALTWMRENAPVYRSPDTRIWGVGLYEDIMTVSKNPEIFCNSGGIRPDAPPMKHMIDLDDPLHKKRRNLVNKGFTVARVQDKEPRIREIARNLIAKVSDKDSFDFLSEVAVWLPLIVIGDMLGVQPDAYPDLLRWSDDLVKGAGSTDDAPMERAMISFGEYHAYQQAVIADRRSREPQSDLVSILVHAEVEGQRLSDEDLLGELLLILIGGDETTRHVINGGLYEVLKNRKHYEALVADPSQIPMAVEEMLRWVTPIQNMARTATCQTELNGQTIEKDDKLLLLYISANRDEKVFTNPYDFDIARNPNEHIAFGFGAHFCMGASLARLELRVLFEELVSAFPNLALDGDVKPPKRNSNFITGYEALPVVRG